MTVCVSCVLSLAVAWHDLWTRSGRTGRLHVRMVKSSAWCKKYNNYFYNDFYGLIRPGPLCPIIISSNPSGNHREVDGNTGHFPETVFDVYILHLIGEFTTTVI